MSGWVDGVFRQDDGSPIYANTSVAPEYFTRYAEVVNYAKDRNISVREAVERLVNSGLSHERRSYT